MNELGNWLNKKERIRFVRSGSQLRGVHICRSREFVFLFNDAYDRKGYRSVVITKTLIVIWVDGNFFCGCILKYGRM